MSVLSKRTVSQSTNDGQDASVRFTCVHCPHTLAKLPMPVLSEHMVFNGIHAGQENNAPATRA